MTATVLVVDDSLTVRMDLFEALQRAGFTALLCSTAHEARVAVTQHSIQLAILDVLLPDGDGVELLEELRSNQSTKAIPILMLSSEAQVQDRVRGMQTGADDYVGKPYDIRYVLARVRELLRMHEAAAPTQTTLVVIDDSVTFRQALAGALEMAGYTVHQATNGEDGLRLATAIRPHAVIVDGVMPGLDGPTVIRRIRLDAALRRTPCLLLTASDSGGDELQALDAGADAFARKESDIEVILARIAALLRASEKEPTAAPALLDPKRVLVVDDSESYLQATSRALSDEGYDVVLARSGQQALEMLAVQAVDCVLLDLLMPGLSGKETCELIKASPVARDVPVIIVTSCDDRDAMLESLSTGADDYITKVGDLSVLKARVRAQIRRKQFEDENRRIREQLLRRELEASEARAARKLAEVKGALVDQLQRKNEELEAFSYSVSHDLRAPLRSIDGFSLALLEDYADKLDDSGRMYLNHVRQAAQRMDALINDLMQLSRVSRANLDRAPVDLSEIARAVARELSQLEPERRVALTIQEDLQAEVDAGLIRVVFDNLLSNAWKFTRKVEAARVEVGRIPVNDGTAFFVRDNGAGFDQAYAARLFTPFQRLHGESEFPGTGIGLATVRRVVDRHNGRTWAEASIGNGATVYFTIGPPLLDD